MTLAEIAEKFPLGSLVVSKKDYPHFGKMGIVVGHREGHQSGEIFVKIAWIVDRNITFEWGLFSDDVQPYGEIEAIKTLIDFAGRLLDGEAIEPLGKPDRENLEDAIDICEGAFGL